MDDHFFSPFAACSFNGLRNSECVLLREKVEMNENAVIELVGELGLAFGAPPEPGKERQPFIDALIAVARFARAVGLREAQWGLAALAYALQDLDAGRVAPVVRRAKPKGSPPDSSVKIGRAHV